ncbi:MAG: polyphosphate polymerase domain-containing protein [Kiritimatiellae bacterium]|nr:polyphosphate polymerase domain-containing protein [Kiritimatiellia bacterium]
MSASRIQAGRDLLIERHEAKYVIPRSKVAAVREFIRPFCIPDPYSRGTPPEYLITTLQLDSSNLALHHAKENDALTRFKLRVRTYGTDGKAPVFLEVKRKIKGVIVKSRVAVPAEAWGEDLVFNTRVKLNFKSEREVHSFLEFVRLAREIGARPVVWLRYTRESYWGMADHYAKVTFDRNLLYQPANSWDSWGKDGMWRSMDSSFTQGKDYPFSGVVLELKTGHDAPRWMVDLTRELELVRTGNCKYSTAVWAEGLFRGSPHQPLYAADPFEPSPIRRPLGAARPVPERARQPAARPVSPWHEVIGWIRRAARPAVP